MRTVRLYSPWSRTRHILVLMVWVCARVWMWVPAGCGCPLAVIPAKAAQWCRLLSFECSPLSQTRYYTPLWSFGVCACVCFVYVCAHFLQFQTKLLVVTDVAARGIDVPLLNNVVNYAFPPAPKLFVHRVGRAARQGRTGTVR